MPDLIPGAPSVVAKAPQNKVGADAFQRAPLNVPEVSPAAPEQSLAAGLEQFGAGLEDLAVPLAKQQGAADAAAQAAGAANAPTVPDGTAGGAIPSASTPKIVGLGPTGLPQVFTPATSFILGKAGDAYAAAHDAGFEATLAPTLSQKLAEFHVQNEGSPQGFLDTANGYAEQWRTMYPGPVGTALANHVHAIAAQHYDSLVQQTANLGVDNAKTALTTQIGDLQSQMRVLSRNGGITTPQYDQYQDQLQDSYDKLGSNPLFKYGPERADSELDQALSTNRAEYTIGQIDSVYTRSGKAAAQQMLLNGIANNEDLNLPVPEREQLVKLGMAHLDYLTSAQKAAIDASRSTTQPMIDLLGTDPSRVTPAMYNEALTRAGAVGDAESILKLQNAKASADARPGWQNMTDQQRVMAAAGSAAGGTEKAALDYFTSQGWSPAQAAGIVGNLSRESRLNPNAINRGDGSDGSDSIGIGQWNGTRAAALRQFAAAQGKQVTDFNTQLAFVQHELTGSESNAANMLRAATDAKSAASAFALGYERPQGFMTGDINEVAGGADRVANAVRIAGGGAATAPAGQRSAPTQAQMDANPYALPMYLESLQADQQQEVKSARNVGDALITQFGQGNIPPAEVTAAQLQIADKYPNELGAQAQKIRNFAAGADLGQAINNTQSAPDRQRYLSQVETLMRSGDLNSMAQYEEAKLFIDRGAKALKEDPWNEMPRRGWISQPPTPVDLSTPQGVAALPQSIAQHVDAAIKLSSYTGAPSSIFSPAETPMMKTIMEQAPIATRVAFASNLAHANMPESIRNATLQHLGVNPATSPLAVAGDIAPYAPYVSHDILQGQALMQADSKLAPSKEDYPTEFAKILPFNDLPDGPARQNYDAAIQALYAKRSSEKNDMTGILNQDRLEKVVNDVTGGVVSWRGGKAIAPWYGATQGDYDAAIRSVSDADLAASRGSDGVPLPAAALKPSFSAAFGFGQQWSLQSVDGGKYLVYPNNGTMPRQYLKDARGGNFVLDLGAKRQAVEAQGLDLAMPFSSVDKMLAQPTNTLFGTGM